MYTVITYTSLITIAVLHCRGLQEMPQRYLETAFLIPMAVPIASIVLIWKIFFHENGALSAWLVNLRGPWS